MNYKTQALTKAIRNLGNMLTSRFVALNKQCNKLKVKCSKTSNASYTERCGAFKKRKI